jgi:Ca2+-binding EF-hand superfamily protein
MNKKTLWITGALIVVVGTAGIASAHGKGFGDRNARGPMSEEMFEQVDADGDGKITKAEMEAYKTARFEAADTDGDGKLSQDEMTAALDDRRMARAVDMVTRLDTDEDGLLSAEELAAGGPRRGPMDMFDKLDADGDGALSLEEMQQARGAFGRHGGKGGHKGYGHKEGRSGHGFRLFGAPDTSDEG